MDRLDQEGEPGEQLDDQDVYLVCLRKYTPEELEQMDIYKLAGEFNLMGTCSVQLFDLILQKSLERLLKDAVKEESEQWLGLREALHRMYLDYRKNGFPESFFLPSHTSLKTYSAPTAKSSEDLLPIGFLNLLVTRLVFEGLFILRDRALTGEVSGHNMRDRQYMVNKSILNAHTAHLNIPERSGSALRALALYCLIREIVRDDLKAINGAYFLPYEIDLKDLGSIFK